MNDRTVFPAARRTQRSTPRAWAALLGLASAALLGLSSQPARADLQPVCDDLAEFLIEDSADTDPTLFSSAGCSAPDADTYGVCEARGNAGPCSGVSACAGAEETIISDTCLTADAELSCCTEFLTAALSSTPFTIICTQTCPSDTDSTSTPSTTTPSTSPTPTTTTPTSPPSTTPTLPSTLTDATCADNAKDSLEFLALELPDSVSTSCGEPGVICDTLGSAGSCNSNANCAAVETGLGDDCTSAADDSGCCAVYLGSLCSTCDPEPLTCFQFCIAGGSSGTGASEPAAVDDLDVDPVSAPSSALSDDSDVLTVVGGVGSPPSDPVDPPPSNPVDTPEDDVEDSPEDASTTREFDFVDPPAIGGGDEVANPTSAAMSGVGSRACAVAVAIMLGLIVLL